VQLIARIGQPARKRHSLQVEIRRPVYMDEATRERNANFGQVQEDLTALLRTLAAYVKNAAA
jgi:N-formylglutamate deformylase